MPARQSAAKAAGATTPSADRDLSHIRVGPPFSSKLSRPCADSCGQDTKGKECAIIENTRSGKRTAMLQSCLEKRPDLAALQTSNDIDSFLSA